KALWDECGLHALRYHPICVNIYYHSSTWSSINKQDIIMQSIGKERVYVLARCVYPVSFRLARPYVHVESVSVPLEKLGVTGSLLCQWEKALGGIVIGTISTKEKAAQAKEDGCHHVIVNKRRNFAERVTKITSG
ncbi:GroES-like zinc-binding alcohol dehydrogenase family protein, partial [Tanacetum coccineum]